MKRSQGSKKSVLKRIEGMQFFKKNSIRFVLRSRVRDCFEKLFQILKPKEKKEILAEMSKFEATTGEWKFLAKKFKSNHLKSFAFKKFKEALGENSESTISINVTDFASEPVGQPTTDETRTAGDVQEKTGFFSSLFKKKSA